MNAFALAPLIIFLPLIGMLFNALVGRRFVNADQKSGERWTGWIASFMVMSALAIAVLQMMSLEANHFEAEIVPVLDWIVVPSAEISIPWEMQIDTLSVTMMLVVTGIGSLIHIYAIGYMHGDKNFSRFFAYFNLFIFFMLILVSGSSYLTMFVGWEGVGLCSFLLIGFWFDRVDDDGVPMNANAGRKAFVVNRIGDFGVILAIILTFYAFGSLQYQHVFPTAIEMFESDATVSFGLFSAPIGAVITAITVLFLLGVAGKSAQIPLYVWLPDAMAGPTPVSALIHAATMVTAGIYLVDRSSVLYELARESGDLLFGVMSAPELVALTGASTALLAGLIAFTQWDIKKVLAYSTVSQLGFMVAAAGMGAYVAALFHLATHAAFKALLFLSSGSVIHGMEHGHHHLHHDSEHGEDKFDPQDMRFMGGMRKKMPTTFWVYIIGTFALAGIFPLAGFWSKDEILAHASANNMIAIYVILIIAAVCTAFYMGRLIMLVFFGKPRHEAVEHAQESPRIMTIPLIILAVLSLTMGALNLPYFTKAAKDAAEATHQTQFYLAFEHWLEASLPVFELSEEHVIHLPHTPTSIQYQVAIISSALALAAMALAVFWVYRGRPEAVEDPDPLEKTPIWWFAVLPLNSIYMKGIVPLFNRIAAWLAYKLDWDFWHDFVHNKIIRDIFVEFANFAAFVLDAKGVDGIVNGAGRITKRIAGTIRLTQTGYTRNYALGVFLGAVSLLVYFLVIASR